MPTQVGIGFFTPDGKHTRLEKRWLPKFNNMTND